MFKKNLVGAVVCGLALTAWCGTAFAELFVDGGFESGAFPPYWRSVAVDGTAPTITSNPAEVYEGTYAAVITKTSPANYIVLDDYTTEPIIVPGERLRVSYAVKRLSGDENSELRVAITVNGLGGSWNVIHNAPNEFSWVGTHPGTDWSVVEYETIVPNDDFQYTNLYVAWIQSPEDSAPGGTPYSGAFAIDSISAIVLPPGGLDGDYNEDEVVDAADYVLWRKNVGQPLGTLPNDSTSANPIDGTQHALWQTNFGSSSGGAGASVVPEPTGLLQLALAACAMGVLFANTRFQRRATETRDVVEQFAFFHKPL